jgi:phage tail protein X
LAKDDYVEACYVVKREGVSLDLACWLHYRTSGQEFNQLPAGTVEQVLAVNPQLAFLPLHLPLGTKLTMPPLPVEQKNSAVRLWD